MIKFNIFATEFILNIDDIQPLFTLPDVMSMADWDSLLFDSQPAILLLLFIYN